MRFGLTIAMAAALVMSVAACSSRSGTSPGAVSADEAAQLNDAAAMLDANSIDANSLDPSPTEGNEQ